MISHRTFHDEVLVLKPREETGQDPADVVYGHFTRPSLNLIVGVKTAKVVKDTYTDEALELMRDNCTTARDLAMIDLLASSGMRRSSAGQREISGKQTKPGFHPICPQGSFEGGSLRDNCTTARDLAMIDLLASSGMRVGELVTLNREDINLQDPADVVYGHFTRPSLNLIVG